MQARSYKDDLMSKNFYRFNYHEQICAELKRRYEISGKFSDRIKDPFIHEGYLLMLRGDCKKNVIDAVQERAIKTSKIGQYIAGKQGAQLKLFSVISGTYRLTHQRCNRNPRREKYSV